jgi:hypothetical protein
MGWKRLSGVEIDVVLYLGVEEDVEEERGVEERIDGLILRHC